MSYLLNAKLFKTLFLLFFLFPVVTQAAPRIVTTDWTIGETLLLLGVTPVAIGQKAAYDSWVGEPRLPEEVADLGLRMQPNRELLAALRPDVIMISSFYSAIKPTLERVAPVATITMYQPDDDIWIRLFTATRDIARVAEKVQAGEQLLRQFTAQLNRIRQCLKPQQPLLVVQFIDERHVRVFGEHSLFNAVMQQTGIPNAWMGKTNYWGFNTATLEELTQYPDATLVVVEPYPAGTEAQLKTSGLWQLIPAVAQKRVLSLPPIWSFGGVASASRFASELAKILPMKRSMMCREEMYGLFE